MDPLNPFARAIAQAPDYVPSYLSVVTPESFELIDGTWRTTARDYDAAEAEYQVRVSADDTVTEVRVNGERVTDLPMLARRPETVLDWFDAIVYLDACGRESDRQDPRWGAAGIEGEMTRMEYGVVERAEHPLRLEAYANPAALQSHLDRVLRRSPLQVEVRPVLAWPAAASTTGFGDITVAIDSGQPDMYCALPYTADAEPAAWYDQLEAMSYDCYAYAHFADAHLRGEQAGGAQAGGAQAGGAQVGGAQPSTISAGTAYRISNLPPYVELGTPDQDATWWALCFLQLDALLLVSPEEGLLHVVVDEGGTSVTVLNVSRRTYAQRHALQERFQRRWGHLADDSIPHTNQEVEDAIAAALAAIGGNRAR